MCIYFKIKKWVKKIKARDLIKEAEIYGADKNFKNGKTKLNRTG
jgi:hypothetical protein